MASARIKVLLLILILGTPVLLYLFLQSFGKNEYQVPIFYENGISGSTDHCPDERKPHSINHLIQNGPCESWSCSQIEEKLVLFSFAKAACNQEYLSQVVRVINQYQTESRFRAVTISLDGDMDRKIIDDETRRYSIPSGIWFWWHFDPAVLPLMQCGFNLTQECTSTHTTVLVDPMSRIRGYYNMDDPSEIDRLITEMAILLNS